MPKLAKTLSRLIPEEKDAPVLLSTAADRRGISLRSKLLLMLLAAGMTSVIAIAWLGYRHGERQLEKNTFQQLTTLRASKKQQIEWYFDNLRNTTRIMGQTPSIGRAMQMFGTAFPLLDASEEDEDILSQAQQEKLAGFYEQEYFPKLDQLEDGKSNVEIFWPRSKAGQKAQSLYIAENPNKVGEKDLLYSSGSRTSYDVAHAKYHDFFRKIMRALKFDDIYLIDGESGDIVYSVVKETDFGTNLLKGPYAHSSLGRLFRGIRANHAPGFVLMEDFKPFPPSLNKPAAFVGTPIYTPEGKFIGIFAVQFAIDELNDFMTSDNEWEKNGLGKTGEIYLVGDDRMMRSNSRFLIEDKKNYLKTLATSNLPKAIIDKIDRHNTTALFQRVDTKAVRDAFNGKAGEKIIEDYRGVRVLSSFVPLDLPDLRWVMLAEIDEREARAPQNRFLRSVLLASAGLLLLLTLASLFIASKFLTPISILTRGVERIRKGEKNVKIDKLANDEFGELGDTFNIMTQEIENRDQIIERQSNSYESLLSRLYPSPIVERLKRGDGKIADSLHQVSVIYIIIHGFSKQTEHLDGTEAIDLLNELVDSLDSTCQSFGIEKVKTIGEHFLAVCGLSVPRLDHARRALDFAHAASREVAVFNARYAMKLALRVGIHSGPLNAGIVGSHSFEYDIWGNSLNIARRIVFEAGLSRARITTHTYHMLNTSEDFGKEIVVRTKVAGKVATFELDLDTTLDENRLDRRRQQKKRKAEMARGLSEKSRQRGSDNADDANDTDDADDANAGNKKRRDSDKKDRPDKMAATKSDAAE